MTTQPVLVRDCDAEVLDADPGGSITLLVDGPVLTCHRSTFCDGADGAPPHVHRRTTELFLVTGGELQVLLGTEVVTLRAGDTLVVPPGVPHAFGAAPGCDAHVQFVLTPGGARFDYYRLLDRVHRGAARFSDVAATQDRYDNRYVDSPEWRAARGE